MQEMAAPQDAIRMRAYQIYESRGCMHGRDIEDWLRAEDQIHTR